ncbi:MAG TPA: alpha-amylase family glycosyl hydrolase, partial [Dehalococcoidia bacterium]|nr:alpha-amylase family glycosyl hydrolase [Dehalococcoidia bacterium]
MRDWRPRHGALYLGQGTTRFRVWAPGHDVELHLLTPTDRYIPMKPDGCGYHEEAVAGTSPGDLYRYRLDGGEEWPDPASRSQPEGPHGPSQIVDPEFAWTDEAWAGVPLERYVVYEAHVGAFTGEGTFRAMIPELPYLRELGITVLELMPVAQFPGERNWGYDGVFPYAAQTSYGGIDSLRSLVDACHAHGLAVCLDVVHNHLGPEGNYFSNFGPYFTDRYRTPWGAAINYDGPESDEVRAFFIENALYWTLDCHIDALRLDAVHAIADNSPVRYLEDLAATVHRRTAHLSRPTYV